MKKKHTLVFCLVFALLLSAGCGNTPAETSLDPTGGTTETKTAIETTETTEFKIATLIPKNFPKNIYLYHFDCEPLDENVDPEKIKITLQKEIYSTQDTYFRVQVFNESSGDIELHTAIFLEKYESNGTDYYGDDYYPGWVRIPFDSSHYARHSPPKIQLSPGNHWNLRFCTKHGDTNCLLESEALDPGKYRFAIYMSGGPRYVEFEITEND